MIESVLSYNFTFPQFLENVHTQGLVIWKQGNAKLGWKVNQGFLFLLWKGVFAANIIWPF